MKQQMKRIALAALYSVGFTLILSLPASADHRRIDNRPNLDQDLDPSRDPGWDQDQGIARPQTTQPFEVHTPIPYHRPYHAPQHSGDYNPALAPVMVSIAREFARKRRIQARRQAHWDQLRHDIQQRKVKTFTLHGNRHRFDPHGDGQFGWFLLRNGDYLVLTDDPFIASSDRYSQAFAALARPIARSTLGREDEGN